MNRRRAAGVAAAGATALGAAGWAALVEPRRLRVREVGVEVPGWPEPLADLRRHTRTSVHAVTAEEPADLAGAPGVADRVSAPLNGLVDTKFTVDADHLDGMIGRLHAARIHTLTVTPPSLDALFMQAYGDALDAREAGGVLTKAER